MISFRINKVRRNQASTAGRQLCKAARIFNRPASLGGPEYFIQTVEVVVVKK
jgi:hypothetical protein